MDRKNNNEAILIYRFRSFKMYRVYRKPKAIAENQSE